MKPIGITLGDPAGIGPEVAARTIAAHPRPQIPWLLVGAQWSLEQGAHAAQVTLPDYAVVGHASAAGDGIALVDIGIEQPADFQFGTVQASCGEIAVRTVEWTAQACLAGELSAMVTCPLNKEAIHAAGYTDDLGHQEILARLAKVEWTATMLMTPGLRVAHLSTHKSLIKAAQYVTQANVLSKLQLVHQTLSSWGLANPRIAVAALNPHGGEGGILGREEIDELVPAVAAAKVEGIDAHGPLPADSVFNRAIEGEFDVVLALYHDQGHIAIKVHNFHQSTTATLGIPFVRTSVDHGTAFDIAGQGRADSRGLEAAISAAEHIVARDLANL
jgi:4-hydroxythreonine-4-phosphate dehydrogenase